jgi:hypothetical protein
MNRLQEQARTFENLVARAFIQGGYIVQQEATLRSADRMVAIDLWAERPGHSLVAEIKWSRLDPIPLGMLRDWAARAKRYADFGKEAELILVVSGKVDPIHASWIHSEYGIKVYDRADVEALAIGDHELTSELLAFAIQTAALEMERLANQVQSSPPTGQPEDLEVEDVKLAGEDLIRRLQQTPRGKTGAKAYEAVCLDIIEYLFGDHLVDAQPQHRSEDGLNIMDVVYRVRTVNGFWKTLTRDFRARVIMFEFKNYTDGVGPQQVYTTERYMSVSAMRPICFLVTRSEPHEHAELAAFGAMRESGKLLVFLSDDDLITMLRFRDAEVRAVAEDRKIENEPSILLDQKIYKFLSTMAR